MTVFRRALFRRALAATLASASLLAAPVAGSWAASSDGTATQVQPQETQQEAVARVERYLTEIDTLHARFLQTSSNGATARGEVWVDRPGHLRFDYDPPTPILIVANGWQVLYYDQELEQTSYVPLSETPLWFLAGDKIDLSRSEDYEVAGVEHGPASLRVHVVQKGSAPGKPGSLTLVFQDDPLELRKWEVVDQQGVTTEVALLDTEFNVPVDEDRFDFGKLDLPRPGDNRKR